MAINRGAQTLEALCIDKLKVRAHFPLGSPGLYVYVVQLVGAIAP